MALLVEENESLYPVAVCLFGAEAEVPEAGNVTHPVKQSSFKHVMHNTAFGGIMDQF